MRVVALSVRCFFTGATRGATAYAEISPTFTGVHASAPRSALYISAVRVDMFINDETPHIRVAATERAAICRVAEFARLHAISPAQPRCARARARYAILYYTPSRHARSSPRHAEPCCHVLLLLSRLPRQSAMFAIASYAADFSRQRCYDAAATPARHAFSATAAVHERSAMLLLQRRFAIQRYARFARYRYIPLTALRQDYVERI